MQAGFSLEIRDSIWLTERALLINITIFQKILLHIFNEVERDSIQKPNVVYINS